jgi:uncharacterized protein YaaW (UPF0174 family)
MIGRIYTCRENHVSINCALFESGNIALLLKCTLKPSLKKSSQIYVGGCMDELRAALELATDSELQELTEILFRRQFNPIDYLNTPDPVIVQSGSRQDWLDALEERFRFLAADGMTVLRGKTQQVTYRQVLMRVARHLKLPYSPSLSTLDLEAELFLSLLQKLWRKLPKSEKTALDRKIQVAWTEAGNALALPMNLRHDPVRLLLEGGTAIAVSSLRPLIQSMVQQVTLHFAAKAAAQSAAHLVPQQLQRQLVSRGAAAGATRLGLARGAFAFLGTALWVWFFADLGWRTIATNYGRIIPTIFTLAQIRLTRDEACFSPA